MALQALIEHLIGNIRAGLVAIGTQRDILIVNPAAKVVEGYQPIMPTYQGQVSEDTLLQLIAYIQSLKELQVTGAQGSPTGGQP